MAHTINIHWRAIRRFVLIAALFLLVGGVYIHFRPPFELYTEIHNQEVSNSERLIQAGQSKRFVRFRQLQGAGFNNQAQEILLYHHLALQTGRSYVYQPLIWRPRGGKASVPLSAFLKGATDGAISEAAFATACPESQRVHVNLTTDWSTQWAHAKTMLDGNERCLVVDDWIFNWGYLASSAIQDIWPSFRSTLSKHFKWSDNIMRIISRAEDTLSLKPRHALQPQGDSYVALHLRRGDFEGHCKYLADTRQGFTTWASLPSLKASVFLPQLDTANSSSVLGHCYPSLQRVLDAISSQVRHRAQLRTLYVLHDGAWDHPLVYLAYYKLREALTNEAWASKQGWIGGPIRRVLQTSDVPVHRGERDFIVAVDVELARRAEVFVGNGYSSFSSQIIALRLSDSDASEQDITLY